MERRGAADLVLLWAVYAAFALAVVLTYARLDPDQLYHVSEDGLDGGLGRALVFTNYPLSLAAIAVLLVAGDRLPRLQLVAWAGIGLCAVTAVPGVVDQADLDARPINVVPAAGVAIAAALTVVIVRHHGLGSLRPRVRGDGLRLGAALVLLVAGLPWLFAEAGLYADDVPGLGAIYMSDELRAEADGTPIRAVHLGEHHGTDGMLLALTALLLSRFTHTLRSARLRIAFAAYLSLMLVYGIANAAQDWWLEQVVKRGWSDVHLPEVLRPEPTGAWVALLAAAAAVYAIVFRGGDESSPVGRLRPRQTRREGT